MHRLVRRCALSVSFFLTVSSVASAACDDLQYIALPDGVPEHFSVTVTMAGQSRQLELTRYSLRAPGFQMMLDTAEGIVPGDPGPVRTYRGRTGGGGAVALSLLPAGLIGVVEVPGAGTWCIEPDASGTPGLHMVMEATPDVMEPFVCGNDPRVGPGFRPNAPGPVNSFVSPGTGHGTSSFAPPAVASNCTKIAEVAWDADYDLYVWHGNDSTAVVNDIFAVMNCVDLIFARDVGITYTVTYTMVRTNVNDPYTSDLCGTLGEFQAEWNTNFGGVARDTAHLASGRMYGSGCAFVGTVCNLGAAYGLSGFNSCLALKVGVTGHELGHNWNAPHCLDSDTCYLMCGACHKIGDITSQVMIDYRDTILGCLDDGVAVLPPLVPNVRNDDVNAEGSTVIDVLANDLDGNCDVVSIASFDAVTPIGGTVTRSNGTGPGGRDELRYTPPAGYNGPDSFTYVGDDGTGLQDGAIVSVDVLDRRAEISAHYRLDEVANWLTVEDSGPNGLDGDYFGSPMVREPPADPGTVFSVDFDGVDDMVYIDDGLGLSNLRSNFTVAAWVNPRSLSGTHRIFGNLDSWSFSLTPTGLNFTTQNLETFDYAINIPLNQWTHVAVVFNDQYKARFYVNGVASGLIPGTYPANMPLSPWYIGATDGVTEFFDGHLDDIQVYDARLVARQMTWLYTHPGSPVCEEEWSNYGTGLPGTNGVPGITVSAGNPRVNNSFTLQIDNSKNNITFGLLYVGFAKDSQPLLGGTVLVNAFWTRNLVVPIGAATKTYFIPDNAACLPVYFQAMMLDAGAVQGWSFTRGLEIVIGV